MITAVLDKRSEIFRTWYTPRVGPRANAGWMEVQGPARGTESND